MRSIKHVMLFLLLSLAIGAQAASVSAGFVGGLVSKPATCGNKPGTPNANLSDQEKYLLLIQTSDVCTDNTKKLQYFQQACSCQKAPANKGKSSTGFMSLMPKAYKSTDSNPCGNIAQNSNTCNTNYKNLFACTYYASNAGGCGAASTFPANPTSVQAAGTSNSVCGYSTNGVYAIAQPNLKPSATTDSAKAAALVQAANDCYLHGNAQRGDIYAVSACICGNSTGNPGVNNGQSAGWNKNSQFKDCQGRPLNNTGVCDQYYRGLFYSAP